MSEVIGFKDIIDKGAEYYQCLAHMHMRGMGEVLQETKPLIKKLIEDGNTFENLEKYFVQVSNGQYSFEDDQFAQAVKRMFEDCTKEVGSE